MTHSDSTWRKGIKISYANGNEKKAFAATFIWDISDKTDIKTKIIIKDKKGHYIYDRGVNLGRRYTFINICAPNTGAPKYIEQILIDLKEETDRIQ